MYSNYIEVFGSYKEIKICYTLHRIHRGWMNDWLAFYASFYIYFSHNSDSSQSQVLSWFGKY